MTEYLIYFHLKADTNQVFYVGQSKSLSRAYSKRGRNFLWHRVVNAHGFKVEIKHTGLSKAIVDLLEKAYISNYGRLNIATGHLVNLTDGGDGTYGTSDSDETKRKKSISHLGKKASPDHKLKISLATTGVKKTLTDEQRKTLSDRIKIRHTGRIKTESEINKLRISKLGKPRPASVREKLSEAKKKPVILTKETSLLDIPSVTEAANFLSCSRKEVCNAIKYNKDYKGFRLYYL